MSGNLGCARFSVDMSLRSDPDPQPRRARSGHASREAHYAPARQDFRLSGRRSRRFPEFDGPGGGAGSLRSHMGSRGRYRRERILLPGEHEGRRSFLKWGLAGGALLALGGGSWLATRRTRPAPGVAGPLTALTPEEATVLLALSERL